MDAQTLARATAAEDLATFVERRPEPALVIFQRKADEVAVDASPVRARAAFFGLTPHGAAQPEVSLEATSEGEVDPALHLGLAPDSEVVFLLSEVIRVGRSPKNDLCLPLKSISKFHAQLCYGSTVIPAVDREGRGSTAWQVVDLGSTNGTFVDDERLAPRHPATLSNGHEVSFGNEVRAVFVTPEGLHALLAAQRRGR